MILVEELFENSGLDSPTMKLQKIKPSKELKDLVKLKHQVFSVDKVKTKNGGFLIILLMKNGEKNVYYFRSKGTSEEFMGALKHSVLDYKI